MISISIEANKVEVNDGSMQFEYSSYGGFIIDADVYEGDIVGLLEKMDEADIVNFLEDKGYKVEL